MKALLVRPLRSLTIGLLAVMAATVLSMQARAETCAGGFSVLLDPDDPIPLETSPLEPGQLVRVSLRPTRGLQSDPWTIGGDHPIRFALTCNNNVDLVPCQFGNDVSPSGEQPIEFAGNVDGSCGATSGVESDGIVDFSFDALTLAGPGDFCSVDFDVLVRDQGTDLTPLSLTSAFSTTGDCETLSATARGSLLIQLESVPDIQLIKEISIDGGITWFDANEVDSAPYAAFPSGADYRLIVTNTGTADLENVIITDPTLGIVDFNIGDLDAAQSLTLDSGNIDELSQALVCGESGVFENIALVEGTSKDDGTTVTDDDPANLVCVGLDLTKEGDLIAKVGDDVDYTFTLQNLSDVSLDNCVAEDDLLGIFFGPDANLPPGNTIVTASRTALATDPNPLPNQAELTCDAVGPVNTVSLLAGDDHEVDLINPAIEVTKSGPDSAKVGDEVTYTIGFTNEGVGALENCTGSDDVLGNLGAFEDGVPQTFTYTVSADDDNPLVNVATITCDVVGFDNQASDSDSHSLNWVDPAIEVTKSAPDSAKVGDEVTYTIGFTNEGVGALENCTGSDDVLGDLGAFEAGVPQTFTYTVSADDDNPLVNVATITCDVVGFDNQASDSDSHSLDIIDPDVELAKQCSPDPVLAGDTIEWSITVSNTGNAALDCLVNDPEAGIVDEAVSLDAGEVSDPITASRLVLAEEFPTISNTASVECSIDGFDNIVDATATADCEVEVPAEEICRTPGFWGTHAGTEHRRSSNLTQLVIDAAGGELSICGQTIDNTNVGNVNSAVEAMCVRIEGQQQRQLARQLTAMALNCVVSGGDSDCTGTSVEQLFAEANAACIAGGGGPELGSWIDQVDAFNNGIGSDCGDRELDASTEIFDGISPFPGPAGSARACSSANGNGIKVVPAM